MKWLKTSFKFEKQTYDSVRVFQYESEVGYPRFFLIDDHINYVYLQHSGLPLHHAYAMIVCIIESI